MFHNTKKLYLINHTSNIYKNLYFLPQEINTVDKKSLGIDLVLSGIH